MRFQVDAQILAQIILTADQDQFGTLVIQGLQWINWHLPAVCKNCRQLFGEVSLLINFKANPRRRGRRRTALPA